MTAQREVVESTAVVRGRGEDRRFLVPLAWVGLGVAWAAAMVSTGTAVATLGLWVLAVALGVAAPGVAVVRSLRRGPASVLADVGWGIPAGCLVAMVGWVLGVASPVGAPPWLLGPLVVGVLVAVPGTRHRVLARPAPGWGVGPNLAIVGVLAVAVVWMTVDFLRFVPPVPGPDGVTYYPDIVFQLAVVGHLRHSIELAYPFVAGEPFHYQWFTHAILAHLVDGGADPVDSVIRLAPASLLPAVIVTAAVVARDLSGRVAAGPIAAALLGVLGTTTATLQADGFSLPMVQTYWWASITTSFGWLTALAAAGALVALLRPDTSPVPTALFIPFALLATGAKPSNMAVLAGGAGLAWLVTIVRRRPARRAFGIMFVLAGLLLVSRFTMYGGGDHGLRFDPLSSFERRAATLFPGLTGDRPNGLAMTLHEVSTVAVIAAIILLFLPLIPRLIGIALLEHRDPATWFFLGAGVAAVVGVLAFRHPGQSELFFLISAYPVLIVGSATGLAAAWDRARGPLRVAAVAVGAVLGLGTTLAVAGLFPTNLRADLTARFGHSPAADEMSPLRQAAHLLAPLGLVTAILLVAYVLARIWSRRATATLIAAVLGTGVLSTGIYLTNAVPTLGQTAGRSPAHVHVTADENAAARWLAANSAPTDVFATNRVCVQVQRDRELPPGCLAKTFAMGAISGRTAHATAWAYTDHSLNTSWDSPHWWSSQPFWDTDRLTAQLDAFTTPTPTAVARLRADGVRWLVADTRGTPIDQASLDQVAIVRYVSATVRIWEIPR